MLNKKNIYFKKILKIFLVFLVFFNFVYAEEEETSLCGAKTGEERYNCQVKNFCEIYKPEEPNSKLKDYFETDSTGEESLFKNAKQKYRENQNNIYSCYIIKLQKNSYNLVRKKLAKIDKTGEVLSRITEKIEIKLQKLETIEKQKECSIPNNKEEDNSLQNKQNLLKESAYEYCKYSFYLDFLKNHYKNIENTNKEFLGKNEKQNSYKISQIAAMQSKIQQDIIDEQNHSTKVFQIAFETYIDYENNHPVHILLELIKEDYIVLRRKLHEAISPINQVVYKINNAMSIH